MTERFLSPSEAARRLGVGVRALRLYERKGLVRPRRTGAGWRVYGPAEIERLHQVLTLKSLGLTLTRIAQLLGGREPDLSALLALHEDVLAVRIHDLERARKAVHIARSKLAGDGRLSLDDLIDLVRETTMTKPFIATLKARANEVLADATIPELPNHYRGKVRDNYDLPDGRRILIATDRLSAFDQILAAMPFKGQVLTQTARFWFEQTADICPNHVLDYPDPNVVVGPAADILPVEIVVRGYLAGTTGTSILTLYNKGRRTMYGHRLPDGMRENEALPAAIITPTTKARRRRTRRAADRRRDHRARAADRRPVGDAVATMPCALFARGQAHGGRARPDPGRHQVRVRPRSRPAASCWPTRSTPPTPAATGSPAATRQRFEAGEAPESFDKDFVRRWVAARCDPYTRSDPGDPLRDRGRDRRGLYPAPSKPSPARASNSRPAGVAPLERVRRALAEFF